MLVALAAAGVRPSYYAGPGDIVSGASAWWGLRAFSSATAATACVIVRRDSDNTTATINTLPDGTFDLATATAFANGASLFTQQLYDQTANGQHLVQMVTANQPKLFLESRGSFVGFSSGTTTLSSVASSTLPQPFSESIVGSCSTTSSTVTFAPNLALVSSGAGIRLNGTLSTSTGGSAFTTIVAIGNAASSSIAVGSGGSNTGSGSSTGVSFPVTYGGAGSGFGFYSGEIGEAGIWPLAFTAPQQAALISNQNAFWAI